MPRYLTKSLFIRALACPTKLFYAGKVSEYADNSLDDEFLKALARGGFQVGALARYYFPDGVLVEQANRDQAVARTTELLRSSRATVFEGAIRHGKLLVRADILVKNGNCIDLIEVKAKSYDQDSEAGFLSASGDMSSKWRPYLYDVAFQVFVLRRAFPGCIVRPYLMLADKRKTATVDGLNQMFRVVESKGRSEVVPCGRSADLGQRILVQVPVEGIVNALIDGEPTPDTMGLRFADFVDRLATDYVADRRIDSPVGVKCRDCEFCATSEQETRGLKSGFKQCWRAQKNVREEDFLLPWVFDLWNYKRKQELIDVGRFLLRDLTAADISEPAKASSERPGLAPYQRQRLQLRKVKTEDSTPYLDVAGLRSEMAGWRFPLHLIDFETSAMALPFHVGRRPYEGIAFQFSHHVVQKDGRVSHAGEFLEATPGRFPNYDFVRALKAQLDQDGGSIFRYASHENTYLLMIYHQLQDEAAETVADREALCDWIRTITVSTDDARGKWKGPRSMVDMRELVLRYHYDPRTNGSNSLKAVLPAVLASSVRLQDKYSRPIYGSAGGIPSRNYTDWAWVRKGEDGGVRDPYSLLPRLATGLTPDQLSFIDAEESIGDGAAALMAYARMQFTQMADAERRAMEKALLKYCELDTFAMVLLWEYWEAECSNTLRG